MKRPTSHLSDEERRKLELWRQAKVSPDVIAEKLVLHRSTIYRKLKGAGDTERCSPSF